MLLKLSESIASHICHDLSNSIGACDTCLDAVRVTSNPIGFDTAKLASESSITRLRYLRHLYGRNVMAVSFEHLFSMAEALIKEGRTTLEITFNKAKFKESTHALDIIIDAIYEKLLLAFIYIANGDLPYGGVIKVDIRHEDSLNNYEIRISSNSDEIKLRPSIYNILEADENLEEITARNVVVYYAKYLSMESGVKYRILVQENKVEYIFQYQYLVNENSNNW